MERRLGEAEAMLTRTLAESSEPGALSEDRAKLTEAVTLVANIKTQLANFERDIQALSLVAGPSAANDLNDRIDATLDEVEQLRARSEDLLATKATGTANLEPAANRLRAHTSDYAKAVVGLLERQEQVLDNAPELKKIAGEYQTLNKTFGKQLDDVESMIQDIHDKEAGAQRVLEAKARMTKATQPPAGIVQKRAMDPSLLQHFQRATASLASRPTRGLRRSPSPETPTEIAQPRELTQNERNKMQSIVKEFETRLGAPQTLQSRSLTQMSKAERLRAREVLLERLKTKQRSEPSLAAEPSPEEMEAFRAQIAEAKALRSAKLEALKQERKAPKTQNR